LKGNKYSPRGKYKKEKKQGIKNENIKNENRNRNK
jgi:hypothetical protein